MRIKIKKNTQPEQKLKNTVDQRDGPGGEAWLSDAVQEEEAASLLSYSKSFGFRLKRAFFFFNICNTQPSSSHTSPKKWSKWFQMSSMAAQVFSFHPTKYCTGATAAGTSVHITSAVQLDATLCFCINESYHWAIIKITSINSIQKSISL